MPGIEAAQDKHHDDRPLARLKEDALRWARIIPCLRDSATLMHTGGSCLEDTDRLDETQLVDMFTQAGVTRLAKAPL